MTYPEPVPEIVLTAVQARLLARLLAVLTIDQVEQLVCGMEEIVQHGNGEATVKFYRGHARFIEKTFTDDLLRS